ncbi:IclR family transcriptional regulator domain-containing protein [Barrientosiimonas endolithica]|uniref:HTH iclR-type domain-containing protein n=1 Tax=Barrientosiimonas endolithica TaxID=1535208 RepID=A0ABN6YN01_9MICO|nr:helix-turn-helix domain-containing protein [Barrientosiimonas endolithica]BDZ58765.1 hypothetical protein GCM10025872_24220 [Barrientosiimonas endolithica]
MSPSPQSEPADLGGETSQTMDRGLALLRLLTTSRSQGATVTELATDLGVGRPVVYRLLASLAREDLVARRADGRVGPGMGLLRLAVSVRPLVVEAAVPHLRRLADTVRATAHLTLAEHGEALAVAVVEPTVSDLHVAYRVGSRHPLEAGAAGRAILLGRADRSGRTSSSPTPSCSPVRTASRRRCAARPGWRRRSGWWRCTRSTRRASGRW